MQRKMFPLVELRGGYYSNYSVGSHIHFPKFCYWSKWEVVTVETIQLVAIYVFQNFAWSKWEVVTVETVFPIKLLCQLVESRGVTVGATVELGSKYVNEIVYISLVEN
ncbi:unnamed protein product [Cuscuta europaea]|uniref:Uncharacterized protein n=1 Tax=Cuscuta europaea TaxID=41803 RepID=A0A9P1E8V8_CUSEU|nr:unnamed protein product [Cuscuta europaea]